MKPSTWRKTWLTAAMWSVLASGAVWAETPQLVVIREAGKPDHRCVIEQTLPQADGRVVHIVRDVATGERLRVVDRRSNKIGAGPFIGKLITRLLPPGDAEMTQALAGAPTPAESGKRTPTTADLAAGRTASDSTPQSAFARLAAEFERTAVPVHPQLVQLKEGSTPALREAAAIDLAKSALRTKPEVVKALMQTAKADPVASVRACGVNCLLQISREAPEVTSVIRALQTDPSEAVAHAARKAVHEIEARK